MNKSYPPRLRELSGCGIFSPKGFLILAFYLALFFAVCHVVGLREHTAFISGTAASPDGSESSTMVFGVIYLCAYFGCVLLAPILVLAATILFACLRLSQIHSPFRVVCDGAGKPPFVDPSAMRVLVHGFRVSALACAGRGVAPTGARQRAANTAGARYPSDECGRASL